MNKICAAGTGSFVEEQAARMGIPLAEFGPLALSSEHPASLGERCTVFIETAIASASAEGVSQADIAAGLCHSIVQNYLHKVVGSKPVGQHIVLQGGVDYNPGIVAAFQSAYGDRVQVSPVFSISGAYGAALLAQEAVGDALSRFVGFDSPAKDAEDSRSAEIQKNIDFYKQADKLLLEGYTGKRDPRKKTVGVPFALMIHKFFPMTNAFFTSLGFNVVLTDPTSEETIRLAQQTAQGETCYPVKLIYGHMQQLIDQKVDYIFLPTIHTMKHEKSRVKHNYGCVYMQTAAASIAKALDIESKGITLLSPVFDLDFGQEAMASAMLGLSKILGIPKPFCAKALLSGAMAVRRHTAAVEKQGKALLATLRPDDKVLVLITRNYGVSDPILNMGIPELLLERGYKVITLSHLPGHALDISDEYNNLYYPFGQHILSGAKLIAHHPNLYAVYLTNHGCGPDTMLSHLFKQEMGDKPYLQIEVDEHFSNVGVITRIEAFLNSLQHRPAVALPTDFNIEQVDMSDVQIGDAALFIRNELLQFGGLACLDDVVHGKILLFQNDFGIDRSTVGFCAAQCFRRYIQHFSGFDRHFLPIDSQKKLAVSLTTQIKSGAVIVFRGNRSACAQGKPCYRHSIAQSGRSGNGHSIPDRANLGKCKRDIVHTAVSSRRATGTMLRTDRP